MGSTCQSRAFRVVRANPPPCRTMTHATSPGGDSSLIVCLATRHRSAAALGPSRHEAAPSDASITLVRSARRSQLRSVRYILGCHHLPRGCLSVFDPATRVLTRGVIARLCVLNHLGSDLFACQALIGLCRGKQRAGKRKGDDEDRQAVLQGGAPDRVRG